MTSLALAVPLTVVSVLGLLLNIYILFVVLITKQVQTANNLLLLHLGIVDSLLCVIFLVFSAPEMLKGWAWLGLGAPCNLHGFLFTLLHPVALWTVCGLNCDRYYAITSPLHYGAMVSPKKVAIGLGVAWFVSLILCIPPLFLVAPYRYNPGLGGCAPDFGQNDGGIWYSVVYTTVTLLLPAVLILGCNLRVLMIARYHRHRIASAIFEVTISAQVTITHQRNPFFMPSGNVFRGRSAVSTVLQLIGSFLILYFPYYGVILWESSSTTFLTDTSWKASSTRYHPLIVTLASTLLTCSPPVNGLLYGVKSKVLRKTFQNYWRKQMSKSEVNQEIQARTPSTCGSRRPSLTPLGFLTRPASTQLQRRLSEVYLEQQKNSNRPSIQRIASELTWRPQSTTGLNNLDSNNTPLKRSNSYRDSSMHKHSSCNTLQLPKERDLTTIDHSENIFPPSYKVFRVAISKKLSNSQEGAISVTSSNSSSNNNNNNNHHSSKSNLSNANLFLQKVFGVGSYRFGDAEHFNVHSCKKASAIQTVLATTPRRSPRILITRAFSEESDHSPPRMDSPGRCETMNRHYSSSATTLIDKKWKKLRYQDEEDAKGSENSVGSNKTESESLILSTPQKEQTEENRSDQPASISSNSSTSTSDEENSCGRMYVAFGETTDSPQKEIESGIYSSVEPSATHSTPLLCMERFRKLSEEENGDTKSNESDGGIWMKSSNHIGDNNTQENMKYQNHINNLTFKAFNKFNDSSAPAYILSWPTRRKSSISGECSKIILNKSMADVSGVSEFQL